MPNHRLSPYRPRPVHWWANIASLALLYAIFYWTSDVFRLPETGSTPWNPEAGLAVTVLYFLGWRALPFLTAIHFSCLALWAPFSSPIWTAIVALGHMAALAAVVSKGRQHFGGIVVAGSTTATAFIIYAVAATAGSALAQMLIASVATDWSSSKVLRFGMTVSVGNMVGILTVFPLLLYYPNFSNIRQFFRRAWWEGVLLISILIATCVAVFGISELDQFKFFYLVFVPVIAIAMRNGVTGAVLAALIASASMILVLSIRGYSAGLVAELQLLMIVLSVTSLVLGAAIDERQRANLESVEYLTRLRENENALMRASRISLASEMVAAVSHELAQPLSATRSHVRALRRRLGKRGNGRDADIADIDAAVIQIDSAAATIRAMREFLRRGDTERVPLQIEHVLRTAAELVGPELRRASICLDIDASRKLPHVLANRAQITQVILNLIRNGRDAISEVATKNGKIHISVLGERPGFVEVHVLDNGPGVTENVKRSLFTPLKSSKSEGLGLGLSLCKSIITTHGGEIWHDSTVSGGARFCFTLPYANAM